MRRLFLGLPLSRELTDHLAERIRDLQIRLPQQGVRWVKPERLHLTLRFAGDLEDDAAAALVSRFAEARFPSVAPLTLTRPGGFPSLQRPKVLYAGLSGEGLEDLALKVDELVEDVVGPRTDDFIPHVTLARVVPGSQKVGRILRDLHPTFFEPLEWQPREVVVFESVPQGAYAKLARTPLGQ